VQEPPQGYLAAHGERTAQNGYAVIPITPGKKSPDRQNWTQTAGTAAEVRRWAANGRAKYGIGIRTEHNPAIDIDCLDAAAADHMQDWIEENIAFTLVRFGNRPKRLLVFRCDTPFRKMQAVYVDQEGVEKRIEILGAGQQFVALHIHPDTRRPYEWSGRDNPTNTPSDKLPILTPELGKRVLGEFGRYALARGWKLKTAATAVARPAANDDPFADVASPVGLSTPDLEAVLAKIPNDGDGQDYDTWIQVIAGIYHETDGSPEGRGLALTWSARSNKHDDRETERKWESLDI
jgi:hypothetical protein